MLSSPQLYAPRDEPTSHDVEAPEQLASALTTACWYIWFVITGLLIFNTGMIMASGIKTVVPLSSESIIAWMVAGLVTGISASCTFFCRDTWEKFWSISNRHLWLCLMLPGTLLAMECVAGMGLSHVMCALFTGIIAGLVLILLSRQEIYAQPEPVAVSVKFPAFECVETVEEIDEEVEEDSTAAVAWNSTEIVLSDAGEEQLQLQGGFKISALTAGEVIYQHVTFMPIFKSLPKAEIFVEGPQTLRAKVAEIQAYGMRIEMRCSADCDEAVVRYTVSG